MKILIGDDSMTQRLMLEAIVKQWGFDAVLAEDGLQAWEILSAEEAPRLVLLDWEMPGFTGLEVCRRVRARQDEDPPYILLLTARSETTDIVAGLEAGANDYISKPFENTELRARLEVGKRMLDLQRELIDARERLEFQASHDALTGLLNRGAVMQAMDQEMERARRNGPSLQVGLIDADHFKSINDTHGHLVGDRVLQEIAQRIKTTLRPYDVVGRYGGEEFLVLIACDVKAAAHLFERLRCAIADEPILLDKSRLKITVSIGFCQFEVQDTYTATELLAAADAAMYKAKSAGRNQVICSRNIGDSLP
jgi:diguanylate cyclase (GGDEF)-like protein